MPCFERAAPSLSLHARISIWYIMLCFRNSPTDPDSSCPCPCPCSMPSRPLPDMFAPSHPTASPPIRSSGYAVVTPSISTSSLGERLVQPHTLASGRPPSSACKHPARPLRCCPHNGPRPPPLGDRPAAAKQWDLPLVPPPQAWFRPKSNLALSRQDRKSASPLEGEVAEAHGVATQSPVLRGGCHAVHVGRRLRTPPRKPESIMQAGNREPVEPGQGPNGP